MENSNIKPKITVLGIGGAGVKIVKHLSTVSGSNWLNLAVADADVTSLNDANLEHTFPVGIEWTRGLGCGGNRERGVSSFGHKQSKQDLGEFISGSSMLIITGGMGGGAGTGGADVLGGLAHSMKIPTIFLVTTPFAFEGQSRQDVAIEGIQIILPFSDIIIPIPNDILFSSLLSDVPAKQAFDMVDSSISHAILGIAEVLRCGNLLATDFSDFKEVLHRKESVCRIGLGVASAEDGENRCKVAVDRLLESPLLGGEIGLQKADVVIMTLIGGDDLVIGEMKQALEMVKGLVDSKAKIISGVNVDRDYNEKLFITVVAVSFQNETDKAPSRNQGLPKNSWRPPIIPTINDSDSDEFLQPELAFQSPSRGYFGKTTPNTVKGEDIDIPPFQRFGLTLDKGK